MAYETPPHRRRDTAAYRNINGLDMTGADRRKVALCFDRDDLPPLVARAAVIRDDDLLGRKQRLHSAREIGYPIALPIGPTREEPRRVVACVARLGDGAPFRC